ncbi:MAG: diguanylate cyclase [Pedobacter sp.]|nr:diguanylate cyclase [Pedobacter sp.]
MTFQGLRLKGALALSFGLLAAVLAGCLTVVIGQHASRNEQQTVRTRLASLAEVTVHVMDMGMYERMHDIVGLAGVQQLRENRLHDDNRQLLEGLQSGMPDYVWLGVADSAGRVLYATHGLLEGTDVSQRPWFVEGQQRLYLGDVRNAVALAPLLPKRADGKPWRFVDIAIPLQDPQSQPLGVLAAHLSWDWVRGVEATVLTPARRKAGIEIFIVNAAGQVIMAPAGVTDTRLPPLEKLGDASASLRWPDGREYLTGLRQSQGYRDFPGLGWRVLTRQPVDKAFASVRLLQTYIIGTGVVLAVIFGLLGMGLAHFISRPLMQLARGADRIRQGDTQGHLPEAGIFRETRQLRASFEELLQARRHHEQELADLNASLEQQVLDRTMVIEKANQHLMSVLEERIKLQLQLEELAATDSLTGLFNRRAFDERATLEMKRAQRQNHPFSIVTFDIDHFKKVNDGYGHDIGDEALKLCASTCREQLREIDICARFGGEEFMILLPETDADGARQTAERLRRCIAALELRTPKGPLSFTASFGVAVHVSGQELATTLHQADQALYAAKNSGRDRVVVFF